MHLKKVRDGVMGFRDTLVLKTCQFSRKGAEGGSLNILRYMNKLCVVDYLS